MAPLRNALRPAASPDGRLSGFLADSVLMAIGFGGTAVTGFVFWWLAAHTVPASVVGLASAAVSAMGLVALAAELGLGPLLIGELPRRPGERTPLVAAGLAVSGGAALLVGALVLALAAALAPPDLRGAAADPVLACAFLGGCAVSTMSSVLDQALIGLGRARLQMGRGLVFGVSRLLALGALAGAGLASGAAAIVGSWLFGLLLPFAIGAVLAGETARRRPRPALLTHLMGRAGAHHLMTAALGAPGLALPVVCAALLGTERAAPFYAALMILSASVILPASLALRIQVADGDAAARAGRVRLSLGVSGLCAAFAALLFAFLSEPLLGLLGPGYPALAGPDLHGLGLAALGLAAKFHTASLARLHGRLLPGAALLGTCGLVEIGAAAIGAAAGGLSGLVGGWLAALAVGTLVQAPAILREASGVPQSTRAP